jgi:hypothetical protein
MTDGLAGLVFRENSKSSTHAPHRMSQRYGHEGDIEIDGIGRGKCRKRLRKGAHLIDPMAASGVKIHLLEQKKIAVALG